MPTTKYLTGMVSGWIGGFLSNSFLGILFTQSVINQILYDPKIQSQLFITVTPKRNVFISVLGLIILSGVHGVFFFHFHPLIPGRNWLEKGICAGFGIWSLYWVFQEWFIYVTLLHEPIPLALLELILLMFGSLIEGLVISKLHKTTQG